MKKTGLLLLLCLAMAAAVAAQPADKPHLRARKLRPVAFPRSGSGPRRRLICIVVASSAKISSPTAASWRVDWKVPIPPSSQTIFVFLAGSGYQTGQQYEIVRGLQDPNRYELFAGQHSMLKAMGQPYRNWVGYGSRSVARWPLVTLNSVVSRWFRRLRDSFRGKTDGSVPCAPAL